MILQSSSAPSFDFSPCPCGALAPSRHRFPLPGSDVNFRQPKRYLVISGFSHRSFRRRKSRLLARAVNSDVPNPSLTVKVSKSAIQSSKSFVVNRGRVAGDEDGVEIEVDAEAEDVSRVRVGSSFASFQEDPIVDKLRTQLGVIHPIPAPPINRSVAGLFVFFFFVGVVFDKVWTSRRKAAKTAAAVSQAWPQVPTSFSLFLEKDLQRKESVEWVNMVLGKLWKVYRSGLENWIIGLLQPVIDDLRKPGYVERVEIRQFSLGDEPLSVRNVERLTSRRVNDLQYQIGIRYTGGARALLMLSLKFGIIPIFLPFGIRDFDIDGELWVKLRLIPTEPFVGAVSVSFVSLPKIKFELSPFRLFNLMAIPVLSMFLRKLLTEDLPRLFVRPKKIVLDFQKGKAVGPEGNDLKSGEQEGNKDSVGELSVTLVDARKLSYILYGKTDPYVVLSLGDQVIRSKNNSKTTVIGPPGEPIWNQDFSMFVTNPRKQKLCIKVKDSLGFAHLTIGSGEVDLGSLKDTVPTDRIVALQRGWGLFRNSSAGEILLRLTYKAYVEDEEDDRAGSETTYTDVSDSEDELFESNEQAASFIRDKTKDPKETDKESFMDVLAALIVSEEFLGIVGSDTGSAKISNDVPSTVSTSLRSGALNAEAPSQDSSPGSEVSRGSALFWLSVVTGVSIIISLSTAGSGLFNP